MDCVLPVLVVGVVVGGGAVAVVVGGGGLHFVPRCLRHSPSGCSEKDTRAAWGLAERWSEAAAKPDPQIVRAASPTRTRRTRRSKRLLLRSNGGQTCPR